MDTQEREIPISIDGCPSEIFPSWMTCFLWEETTDATFLSELLQNLEDLAVFFPHHHFPFYVSILEQYMS